MYSVADVIANIDKNSYNVMILGAICSLCAYVQYFVAVWIGRRDKSHAIPLAANVFFFSHDTHFALKYNYWFHEINHWFFKGGWVTIIIWICLEIIVAWQIIVNSGKEIGLGSTLTRRVMSYLAIQTGMYIIFLWLLEVVNDPLNIILNPATIVVSSLFNISMLIQRKSRRGQSLWIAGALVVQQPVFFFLLNPMTHPLFTTPIWYITGAGSTVLASVYFWMLYKAPKYDRSAA
jgi:hypothetical protein